MCFNGDRLIQVLEERRWRRAGRLREMGMRPGKAYGVGLEFESLREYRPDDDFRRINWKASARKGRIIAQNFDVERSQSLMIVLDSGRMMMTGVAQMTKIDYAINAALLLSYVAMKEDDRVGLLTFSREVKRLLPPAKGKRQLHVIINALQKKEDSMEEPDFSAMDASPETLPSLLVNKYLELKIKGIL